MGHRKYACDDSFFEKIDSEEKAYWLGFIAADGCIRDGRVWSVMLSSVDRPHLERLKSAIRAENPVADYHPIVRYNDKKRGKYTVQQHVSRITISSPKMVADLARLGVVRRKSLILRFPSPDQVPNSVLRHFVRGYFDGDGCIAKTLDRRTGKYRWRVEILSTEHFIGRMYGRFLWRHMRHLPTFYQHPTSAVMYIRIGCIDDIHTVGDEMYRDATVYLSRKRDLFLQVQPPKDTTERIRDAIVGEMCRTQDSYCFNDLLTICGEGYSKSTFRNVFQGLAENGNISRVGMRGPNILYAYDFEDQCDTIDEAA